jgi:hypothetical protein
MSDSKKKMTDDLLELVAEIRAKAVEKLAGNKHYEMLLRLDEAIVALEAGEATKTGVASHDPGVVDFSEENIAADVVRDAAFDALSDEDENAHTADIKSQTSKADTVPNWWKRSMAGGEYTVSGPYPEWWHDENTPEGHEIAIPTLEITEEEHEDVVNPVPCTDDEMPDSHSVTTAPQNDIPADESKGDGPEQEWWRHEEEEISETSDSNDTETTSTLGAATVAGAVAAVATTALANSDDAEKAEEDKSAVAEDTTTTSADWDWWRSREAAADTQDTMVETPVADDAIVEIVESTADDGEAVTAIADGHERGAVISDGDIEVSEIDTGRSTEPATREEETTSAGEAVAAVAAAGIAVSAIAASRDEEDVKVIRSDTDSENSVTAEENAPITAAAEDTSAIAYVDVDKETEPNEPAQPPYARRFPFDPVTEETETEEQYVTANDAIVEDTANVAPAGSLLQAGDIDKHPRYGNANRDIGFFHKAWAVMTSDGPTDKNGPETAYVDTSEHEGLLQRVGNILTSDGPAEADVPTRWIIPDLADKTPEVAVSDATSQAVPAYPAASGEAARPDGGRDFLRKIGGILTSDGPAEADVPTRWIIPDLADKTPEVAVSDATPQAVPSYPAVSGAAARPDVNRGFLRKIGGILTSDGPVDK